MDSERPKEGNLEGRLQKLRLKKLMGELAIRNPKATQDECSPFAAKPEQDAKATEDLRQGAASKSKPSVKVAEKSRSILINSEEESEIVLRRLIAIESHWQDMQPYAWDIFERYPSPKVGGKVIELAYLHGDATQLVSLLGQVKKHVFSAYFSVSPDLRPYLVLKLWQQGKESILNQFLHHMDFSGQLLPIERLYVFWSLYGGVDSDRPWKYYCRNKEAIEGAAQQYGSQLKLRPSYFYLELGKLAYRLGKQDRALGLLDKVASDTPEFKEALELLIRFKVDLDANGHCIFGRQLAKERDWRLRMKIFEGFFDILERHQGVRHLERAALNQVLADPIKWFPETVDAWQRLSQILIKHSEKEHLLPNILAFHLGQSGLFHSPIFERAIWEPVLRMDSHDEKKLAYWQGVAKLHRFVANHLREDSLLWEAKEQVEYGYEATHSQQLSWGQLHKNLVHWLGRSSQFNEIERRQLMPKVKVVGHYLDVSRQDILSAIDGMNIPDFTAIDRMMAIVKKRDDAEAELQIIRKKAVLSSFTNENLDRIWQISSQLKQPDLAWRTATVLAERQVLSSKVEGHWILSGERKKGHTIRALPANTLGLVYQNFAGDKKAFVENFLTVGSRLPELLSLVNRQIRPHRRVSQSIEEQGLDEILTSCPWLWQGKRVFSDHPEFMTAAKAPFAELMPDSPWTRVFCYITDRLGISAWRWQLSRMQEDLQGLLPKLNTAKSTQDMGKAGKWLRTLTPMQRKSWYGLMRLSEQFLDEQAAMLIARLVARLSVCLYPDHVDALSSISKMEAPLEMKWDLECFLLSEEYSEIRHRMLLGSRYGLPHDIATHALMGSKIT